MINIYFLKGFDMKVISRRGSLSTFDKQRRGMFHVFRIQARPQYVSCFTVCLFALSSCTVRVKSCM